jgi:signal transduction histidine kinase
VPETAQSVKGPLPLAKWLWRSYIRAALVPLLLIELSFVAIYWATGQVVYDRSADVITRISTAGLHETAVREANIIARRFENIAGLTRIFADQTGLALATPSHATAAEKARHAYDASGAFYTTRDNGGAAVFYSGVLPIGPKEQQKVWRTVGLDPIMRSIKHTDPIIAQLYLNTYDSYNRIYPYFDVLEIYPPKMDIPSYNFYYEADQAHNPDRKVVWTAPYVDPAGGGWMVSAIAPVYGPNRLEAVVGIDVTVGDIVEQVLNIQFSADSYAMLVSSDGTILALPPKGEKDWRVNELIEHSYSKAILQDTFKPEEFNVFLRPDLAAVSQMIQLLPSGHRSMNMGRPMIAAWSTIAGPDWKLIVLTSEDSILAESATLRAELAFVSKMMVAILLLFYLGYFMFLWRRSVSMSRRVAQPLAEIEALMVQISDGASIAPGHTYEVAELQTVGDHLVRMGNKLQAASRAKTNFLSAMSHELRTPLNAILGLSELLQMAEGQTLTADKVHQLKTISASGAQLLELVEGVIELSRIEKDEIQLLLKPVAVLSLAYQARSPVMDAATERAITITVQEPATPLQAVKTDADVIRRILTQLLSNAVKYNHDGGSVRISFDSTDPAHLKILITDTGIGISADMQAKVFTPFERLGQENSAISGTGIGLTICKRLANLVGADVSFDSTPGKGSCFTLSVPSGN